jgi:hypothetical protein
MFFASANYEKGRLLKIIGFPHVTSRNTLAIQENRVMDFAVLAMIGGEIFGMKLLWSKLLPVSFAM